ncbi:MAG: hypothetical protein K6E50_14135 [Lachnospiraceae bacterium]|nr:hypothetical protein [Lachnospiraceae bacterium]
MAFTSLGFLFFALATVTLYFVFPKKWQWLVLFAANLYFYSTYEIRFLVFLLAAGLISYAAALILEKQNRSSELALKNAGAEDKDRVRRENLKRKKRIAAIAIPLILSSWIVIKYGRFFISNINALIGISGTPGKLPEPEWILPLGMSFYTFHAIAYLIDVYRKKYPAERNFLKYFTFLSFFPHMIQGPFSRFGELGKSIFEEHRFSTDRLREGSARILWGMFKKIVIADPLAATVSTILGDHQAYGGVQILFAVFVYSVRLYADFSGYMDIACGLSHILGIRLAENFRRPFFAKTVDEYWRRWHVTLGFWFRDYVFYPASMGKAGMKLSKWARSKWGPRMGKLISGYFALIFVWTATGLWHGANWTYLVWGYLNLFVIVSTMQLGEVYDKITGKLHIRRESLPWKLFCMLRTFLLISVFRFFSIAPGLKEAFSTLGHTVLDFRPALLLKPSGFLIGMYREEILMAGAGILAMLVVDILQEKEKWDALKAKVPFGLRAFIYACMLLMITLMVKGADMSQGFMYANF